MSSPKNKTDTPSNHPKNMLFSPSPSTGNAPRKGKRIPLNKIKYNEQRDEETSFGYFGARYMDHELMTMWLSVDPMAAKYPSISPYVYCAWNPVKLVDPDGNEALENDDWYKNGKGEIRWFNSSAESQVCDGEKYTRVGETALMTTDEGDVVYGDQYGNVHNSVPLRMVSILGTLTDFERIMRNPLVRSIHRSAAVFWSNAFDIGLRGGSKALSWCGLGLQTVGFYCMLVPGGQFVGAELFTIGKGISNVGVALDAFNNARKKDWTGLTLDIVSFAIPKVSMKQYTKGTSSGFFSPFPNDANILDGYISTRIGYIIEFTNIGRRGQ